MASKILILLFLFNLKTHRLAGVFLIYFIYRIYREICLIVKIASVTAQCNKSLLCNKFPGCDGSHFAISVTVPVITEWGEHVTANMHIAYTEIQISYKNSKQTYGEFS